MAYEYYWLRNYIALVSEPQVKLDLEKKNGGLQLLRK